VIHAVERAFTHYMPVIICPAPYFGVEFINQIGGRLAQRCFDGFSDTRQEAFDVLLGRLDEQFPIGVSAHVLSEKIKALRHGRDDCLRRRKFKPAFSQKLLDEGLDFSFQQFFRFTGDDKVSSPGEFHPEALSELYMNLSAHTAPTMEPRRTPICQ